MNKPLTRGTAKSVQPKLATWEEKEKARALLVDQIDAFFKDGGVIEEVKQGATGLVSGYTQKQRERKAELSEKGKKGAEHLFNKNRKERTDD